MASYDDARAAEFTAAATKKITGVALEVPEESALVTAAGRIPILLCECYTDPCDCHGPIIWTEEVDVHQRVTTERQSRAGQQLHEFKIDVDATVLVESIVRAKIGDLGRRRRRFNLNPSSHLPAKSGCGGQSEMVTRSGSYYDGQECGGHTLFDVYVEEDGLATTFHYVPVGSC